MRTACSVNRAFALTERTNLCSGFFLSFLFLLANRHSLVNKLDKQKDNERHNQEIDNSRDKLAVIESRAENLERKVVKVHSAEHSEQRRGSEVCKRRARRQGFRGNRQQKARKPSRLSYGKGRYQL